MTAGRGIRFSAYAATNVGMVREGNEDSFYRGTTVFAVADGMGGHVAGEVASETALEPIADVDGRQFAAPADATEALADAIVTANRTVFDKASADPGLRGMGTTLTAVMIRDGRLHVAHVGDSRAYLLRSNEEISPLTTDHTLVQQLIDEGRLSRDEANTHPQRSVITRAIGVDRQVEVDTLIPLEMLPGDQILLCSDGLTGVVKDSKIAEVLLTEPDGQAACETLIETANTGGGPDNITVVLLRVDGEPGQEPPPGDTDVTAELGGPGSPPPAGAGPTGPVTRIRTREANEGGFDAAKMGRYGGPQGVELRSATDPPGRGRRILAGIVAALLLLAVLGAGGYLLVSRAYFVGDDDGRVAVFRGLAQEPLGVSLHRVELTTDIDTAALPTFRQERLREGIPFPTRREAERYVENDLRRELDDAEQDGGDTAPAPAASPTDPTPRPAQPTQPAPRPIAPAPTATA